MRPTRFHTSAHERAAACTHDASRASGRTSAAPARWAARAARCAACVALTLGLAAGPVALVPAAGADGAQAWAQNLDNPTVPTDDTGVVETQNDKTDKNDAENAAPSSGATGGSDGAAGAGQAGTGGEEVADAAGQSQDDAGTSAGDGATAEGGDASQGTSLPLGDELVLGDRKDNLVNPQQKPDSSFIYDTSISALQEADAYMNDQTVQVTGEVVGDCLAAELDDEHCWIVLQSNEENYAEVPVFIGTEMAELIDTYGSYGHKGTTLQIRGTFHLACPDHEGLSDLHADTVAVVEKGSVTEQVFDINNFIPGIALVLLGGVMMLIFHRMREGQR